MTDLIAELDAQRNNLDDLNFGYVIVKAWPQLREMARENTDMYEELRQIAIAVGRTKDGTGEDEDWHDIAGDVKDMARDAEKFRSDGETITDRYMQFASLKGDGEEYAIARDYNNRFIKRYAALAKEKP